MKSAEKCLLAARSNSPAGLALLPGWFPNDCGIVNVQSRS